MLREAARRAEAELEVGLTGGRKASSCKGPKDGRHGPFDGIYLPNANSFFCGIVHDTPHVIVFSPEGTNMDHYEFNQQTANSVRRDNYEARNYIKGVMQPTGRYEHQVLITSELCRGLFHRSDYYSLECYNCQCEWLSLFMTKARTDIKKFRKT